ncbi:siderophore synthetase component [Pseudomonas duriflava]|uniref:Siderophore synthetase component n=1 Tax=Pseudomonas duriflava TaxID=459528 RepID=A0A562Q2P9_9PSED|nr:IucA/IucC family siderophore biosynthesis protein [Pseudomonas duriflava]TWI50908.1 siderophore synthetase component [Pseudomonas duriflava]
MNQMITALPAATPGQAALHLTPERWSKVNRLLVRKALAEFAHEKLIEPAFVESRDGWDHYRLSNGNDTLEYRFRAQKLALDHWLIDTASIEKSFEGESAPLDALEFIIEFKDQLGIQESMMPVYLDEISSTLYGSAYKHAKPGLTAEELTRADFQAVETGMMEGHPGFVANNGRMGFDANDYRAYAPEAASPVQLIWLAVRKTKATFSALSDLDYDRLLQEELGTETVADFNAQLTEQGLNPNDYLFMPAHPWQWFNKLAMAFSADVANRNIVCLGYGEDQYLAQQSIRTFFNVSHPEKRYVKTALSILNMGFMRGLSPYYMLATPAINEWLKGLIESDPFLTENGFSILREVASVGYRNHYYETALVNDTPYKKMLSALWRESPVTQLKPGQRLMTMASLLHLDAQGNSLLTALIASSGVDTDMWLRRYLNAYLTPLLHCFYAHDLVYMPHGENLILVLDNNVPSRAIMKDIAEEIAVLNPDAQLPEKIKRLAVSVPEELKILSIFTDVFDCFFRYMNAILVEHAGYDENRFWSLVADTVRDYQQGHPQHADKFVRYDLFAPEFIRSCLNRLQLGNNQQMINLADPAGNLKFAGTLSNPIARFKA